MDNLYERIMILCNNRSISGYRLCKELNIQPSVLTDIKMGRQKGLSAKNADKIASYFGISVGYLLGTEEQKKTVTIESDGLDELDMKFISMIKQLSEQEKRMLLAQMEALIQLRGQ